jgi:hypothetical protein
MYLTLAVSIVCITALFGAGCGKRGTVLFRIEAPSNAALNPIDDRIISYTIRRTDGALLGVASQLPGHVEDLPLGVLAQIMEPTDLVVNVTAGERLVGSARLRDVTILNGVASEYVVQVRKPLLTIGATAAEENAASPVLEAGQIIDGATAKDLTPIALDGKPRLPAGTRAATFSWDGRFLFAGNRDGVHVIDTGSGAETGVAQLGFVPTALAVGRRDSSLAALDAGGAGATPRLALVADVASLESAPMGARPMMVALEGLGSDVPRRMAFSRDGQRIFVLVGKDVPDACAEATPPTSSRILVFNLDGTVAGTWTLSTWVHDFAVDPGTGALALSDVGGNQVALLDETAPFGPATLRRVAQASCPSAIGIANGEVYVVTGATSPSTGVEPDLVRIKLNAGASPTSAPFGTPSFVVPIPPAEPGSTIAPTWTLLPMYLAATGMALTPDGARAFVAARAVYRARNQATSFEGYNCFADYEIVEHVLYSIDAQTGDASYVTRSQNVVRTRRANGDCIECDIGFGITIGFECRGETGDRAAGMAASFGAP